MKKKPTTQKRTFWQIFFKGLRIVFFVGFDLGLMLIVSFGIIFFYTYYNSVPAERLVQRVVPETTLIFDKTGEHILYKIHGEENRKIVAHDALPDTLRNATVAIEDERFYKHIGADIFGIMRSLKENISANKRAQGGSTITQQLVRNAFLTREKTITRKFKEIVLAIKIERHFSKEDILDIYLNEVPYGSNAYGAQAAAETFFGKNAIELTVDEAALLASLPKATTYLSPYGSHSNELQKRQQIVLRHMGKLELYDDDIIRDALRTETLKKVKPFYEEIDAPHFVFYVQEQLEKLYGKDVLEQGGFHVYTTLDYEMQKRAEKIVSEYAKNLPDYGASNAALLVLDPRSGGVQAMVGSINYHSDKIDGKVNVTTSLRQPGSAFKPLIYAAAFEKGYQPETLLYDVVTNFGTDGSGKAYKPENFDRRTHGLQPMRKTLAGSLNIPAVKTLYLVGLDDALDFVKKLGITSLTERERYGLSLVLGSGEVTLLEELGAFAVFANDGARAPVHGITKLVTPNGEEVVLTPPQEIVIDAEVARKINSILSDNDARAYIFGRVNPLHIPDKTVAAKTGTTQDFRDAWTLGYTPSLAVGVWIGNNDAKFMAPGSLGSKVASPLWRQFMEAELANRKDEKFVEYTKVPTSPRAMITGSRVSDDSGDVRYYELRSGKSISARKAAKMDADDVRIKNTDSGHSILYYVNKENPLMDSIKPNFEDPMLKRWDAALGNKKR